MTQTGACPRQGRPTELALTKVEAASFVCPFAQRPVMVESFLLAKVSIGERARRSGGHVTAARYTTSRIILVSL